jgi:hypothetical protein
MQNAIAGHGSWLVCRNYQLVKGGQNVFHSSASSNRAGAANPGEIGRASVLRSLNWAMEILLLSNKALGVGGASMTLHPVVEKRVHALFGVPRGAQIVYCAPVG